MKVILAPQALQDIEEIVRWTTKTFGSAASRRYSRLLRQAISDVGQISIAELNREFF